MEHNISKSGNLVADTTNSEIAKVPFGGNIPELGFSLSEWRKAYFNNEIDSNTNEEYGYCIPTDDGSIFGSKVNQERVRNGFKPI